MVEWNQLDVASFLEQASGFLAEHGQLDGPSCHAPPAKRARSVGPSSYTLPLSFLRLVHLNTSPPLCVGQIISKDKSVYLLREFNQLLYL